MKHTKRLLAALLALALALTLALPAMAAAGPQSAVNWDEFYIITQPQSQTIAHGESFTLSVEVNVPEGVTWVEYQWRRSGGHIADATEAVLMLSPGYPGYPRANRPYHSATGHYFVVITAVAEDEDGNVIDSRTLHSEVTAVTIQAERRPTLWENLRVILAGALFLPLVLAPMLPGILLLPITLPLTPLFLLFFWAFPS